MQEGSAERHPVDQVLRRMTTPARRVVFFGFQLARRRGAESLDRDYFLMGLIEADPDLIESFLRKGSSLTDLKEAIEARLSEEKPPQAASELPLTEASARALLDSMREAERLGWNAISTICLLHGDALSLPVFATWLSRPNSWELPARAAGPPPPLPIRAGK